MKEECKSDEVAFHSELIGRLSGFRDCVERTNRSVASRGKLGFCGDADFAVSPVAEGAIAAGIVPSFSKAARNGFVEVGRGSALRIAGLVSEAGDPMPGECARLRKGLLEDKFSVKPGDARRSAIY